MRTVALCLVALATAGNGLPAEFVQSNQELLWRNFKASYNKQYSAEEEDARKAVFVENMLKAARQEKENPRAEFGMNAYSDLSAEEFKVYHSGSFPVKEESPARKFSDEVAAAADPVDWRKKGAVTQVKNQAQCGSCWAFSTTGGIEGQWFLAGNTLTSLSEQMLVSCDTKDDGCGGGLMDNAFEWLVAAHDGKIVKEEAYPYHSGDGISGRCKWDASMAVGAQISGHEDIAHNEDEMATWVSSNGPLSIAVDAQSWQTYNGGIMTNCRGTRLDHGVLLVGWEQDYWIVKNSWGPNWGENGYIRIHKGTNQCGIRLSPSSSKVSK